MSRTNKLYSTKKPARKDRLFAKLCASAMMVGSCTIFASNAWCRDAMANQSTDSPLRVLGLLGMEPAEFEKFVDGQPLGGSERDVVLRILFNLPRFEATDIMRWQQSSDDLDQLSQDPGRHRAEIFSIAGRVTRIAEKTLDAEDERRFRFATMYELTVRIANERTMLTIWCREVPNAWKRSVGKTVDFATRFHGLFLKIDKQGDDQRLFFVANRMPWHPQAIDPDMGILADHRFLGVLGVDIGLFDVIKHASAIKPDDRESFYQFLQAMGHVQKINVQELARDEFDIVALLEGPETEVGLAYHFDVTARRAIRILVDDTDIQNRYGIDHYYEIETFVPLDRPLKLVDPKTEHSVEFNDYPIVFCVRELPKGMPEGNNINLPVRMTGFYFKLWAFRNERMVQGLSVAERKRIGALQKAPLFIGLPPEIVVVSKTKNRQWEIYAGVGFIVLLFVGWMVVLQFGQQDRKFESHRKDKDPKVDFSNIENR